MLKPNLLNRAWVIVVGLTLSNESNDLNSIGATTLPSNNNRLNHRHSISSVVVPLELMLLPLLPGDTDDVSYAILYLASDESKFMTGTEIVLDGGLSAM